MVTGVGAELREVSWEVCNRAIQLIYKGHFKSHYKSIVI